MDKIIQDAITKWKFQGRTDEQIWAVENFMSGAGKEMVEEIKIKLLCNYLTTFKTKVELRLDNGENAQEALDEELSDVIEKIITTKK